MYWTLTVLLTNNQITTPDGFTGQSVVMIEHLTPTERQLLCHIACTEDADHADAYSALTCFALASVTTGAWHMQLAPITELTIDEQRGLRSWLIDRRWAAWARAPHHLRALLGAPEPLVPLAEAARQLMLPLATLGRAAQFGRVPVIRAGDRVLVYPATIAEAQARGLLHAHAGRPRRG